MPRVPRRPRNLPPLGEIIWDAMEQRTAERGEVYTYTDLAREMQERTGRTRGAPHIRNVVTGERWLPEPEVLADIAAALRPHVDLDQLMIAAGRVPESWSTRVYQITTTRGGRTIEDARDELEAFHRAFLNLRDRLAALAERAHAHPPAAAAAGVSTARRTRRAAPP